MSALQDKWSKLNPKQQRSVVIACVIGVVLVIGSTTYQFAEKGNRQENHGRQQTHAKKKEISFEKRLMEQSALSQQQANADRMAEILKQQEEEIKRLKEGGQSNGDPILAKEAAQTGGKKSVSLGTTDLPPLPPAISSYPPPQPLPPGVQGAPMPAQPVEQEIGAIEVVTNNNVQGSAQKASRETNKKKAGEKSIFLPPSYMEATLLSGLDAPTGAAGSKHPAPALLRIKDIAILPNNVKADLKGCFLVAEGTGRLSDERAHLRLLSLSCVSRNGEAVIYNDKIEGFIVDGDGKVGLRGRVVTKMGALIGRSMFAGMLGGFGNALSDTASTVSTSALGTTSTLSPSNLKDVGIAGVGEGLSSGFRETQKFFLDLAKEQFPVIEIGATRKVTVVIKKGVDLEVMNKGGR